MAKVPVPVRDFQGAKENKGAWRRHSIRETLPALPERERVCECQPGKERQRTPLLYRVIRLSRLCGRMATGADAPRYRCRGYRPAPLPPLSETVMGSGSVICGAVSLPWYVAAAASTVIDLPAVLLAA